MISVKCSVIRRTSYNNTISGQDVEVQSNDLNNMLVKLVINGSEYIVSGDDMITAIQNCMNTNNRTRIF